MKNASAKFIYVVDNGYSQCIPAVPTAVAELQKSTDTLKDNIKESIDILHEILDMVPESKLKNAFQSSLVNITAANALVQKTTAATGEANLADIVKPHPGVVPTGECSHLRRHHPLLSEMQEKFHKHLPTSTQSKLTGSQDIDEHHLDSSMQDTETQHDQGAKGKFQNNLIPQVRRYMSLCNQQNAIVDCSFNLHLNLHNTLLSNMQMTCGSAVSLAAQSYTIVLAVLGPSTEKFMQNNSDITALSVILGMMKWPSPSCNRKGHFLSAFD